MKYACPKCGGPVQLQAVSEMKKRGCMAILIYLVLLCIPIIGWIALFMLLRGRKSETVTYAVCQRCGFRTSPVAAANKARAMENQKNSQQNVRLVEESAEEEEPE